MTLQVLGTKAGMSVGYLSQVERGKATPSLGSLSQIASALGVDVDFFVRKPKASDGLTRSEGRARFAISGSSIEYEQIGANLPGSELTSFVMNVPPGYESELVCHVGEEIIYILEGEISQTVSGRSYTMTAGDTLHYFGVNPHSWANKTDRPARILWVGRMQYAESGRTARSVSDADGNEIIVPLQP
ncbi:helix-turn-helix domain-containing protein [Oceaniglobus roseus]|uniref:helix-turn-helix domain-containing protein n=1 Tax=Oceaniglobus roseus TaxID=1737570 RepID=UPI001FE4CCFB|nr:XRE family transcriptional regulator [Kandeliimicrobium roseum]